jgi:SCY1-like protein 1
MGQGVSGGTLPDFPYSVGQEVCRQQPHGLWSLVDGEERSTKKPVSIFVLHADGVLATNFLKRFKTLRHPNLLPFLHGAVLEDQKKAYVVTERVEPLLTKLASSEYHNDPKYQHILAWGLHCVAVRNFFFETLLPKPFY